MDKTGTGIKKCFENVIKNAKIDKETVDLISTHGTATKLNDKIEAEGIKYFFGVKPYIQAFKSYFGHTMGASSAIQTALLSKTFQTNNLIKINHLENEEINLNFVKTNLEKRIGYALNNAFGFGGINSSLLLGRE